MLRKFRIHGDNIVECERTLALIAQAFAVSPSLNSQAALYLPVYSLSVSEHETFQVELLSGYDRWGINIAAELLKNGGVLRECADSYISEIIDRQEHILLALEYCSALPAGNNAWQRNGRAYSSVLAGVPYLYFAEIGGVELDTDRNVKAPRFPNPVVPFSYIATTKRMSGFCIPVYQSHTTITEELNDKYRPFFGLDDCLLVIKGIITKTNYSTARETLIQKSLSLVKFLADNRKGITTLQNNDWDKLLGSYCPCRFLEKVCPCLIWKSKKSDKVPVSATFKILFAEVDRLQCAAAGAKDLPICIIPATQRSNFEKILKRLYPKIPFLFSENYLVIVWITGFKPEGDDSRPDRGLVPLARMVLGEDADILVIVSGPAKTATWDTFKNNPKQLAADNGLWQAIFNVADFVLIDSPTCFEKLFYKTDTPRIENANPVSFSYVLPNVEYSEHDTDTVIHQIFSRIDNMGIYECMCNPPGGDWSGVNYYDKNGTIYRWTSLPRVSPNKGKRPDHVIQLPSNVLLSIESKRIGRDLEDNIGIKLKTHINDLFQSPPTSFKTQNTDWRFCTTFNHNLSINSILTAGAFIYTNEKEMLPLLQRCKIDIILAFEFGGETTLHLLTNSNGQRFTQILEQITRKTQGLKIQIH